MAKKQASAAQAGPANQGPAPQARLQTIYREKIVPDLMAKFGFTSVMQVPRLQKITLNMGVSEAVSDKKVMDSAVADLTKIAGQKPVVTKSKKPIASGSRPSTAASVCASTSPAAKRSRRKRSTWLVCNSSTVKWSCRTS